MVETQAKSAFGDVGLVVPAGDVAAAVNIIIEADRLGIPSVWWTCTCGRYDAPAGPAYPR